MLTLSKVDVPATDVVNVEAVMPLSQVIVPVASTALKVEVPATDVVNVEAVIPLFTETPLAPGVKVVLPDGLLKVIPELEAVDKTILLATFVVIVGVTVELLPSTINSVAVIVDAVMSDVPVPLNRSFNSLISGGLRIVLALISKFDFD
jgi:hypothetical protein